MPVDCRGKLLHPLDLPQQLSHLDCPVTSVFCLSFGLSGYICFFVFSFFDLLWQLSYLNCQVTSCCVSLSQHFHNLMYRVRSYQSEFALESFVAPQVGPR